MPEIDIPRSPRMTVNLADQKARTRGYMVVGPENGRDQNLIQEKKHEELLEDRMVRRLKEVRLLRRKLDLGIRSANRPFIRCWMNKKWF
jgi:hypothetical protein